MGVEREREVVERLQEKYLRWVLADWSAPGCMVRVTEREVKGKD